MTWEGRQEKEQGTIGERKEADYHAVHIHFQFPPVFPQTPFHTQANTNSTYHYCFNTETLNGIQGSMNASV